MAGCSEERVTLSLFDDVTWRTKRLLVAHSAKLSELQGLVSHTPEHLRGKARYIFQATKTAAQSGKLTHVQSIPSPTAPVSAPMG